MLTQNGIPKPVYHAVKMLKDAGEERLDLGEEATKGEIGYAAFRGDGKLQVLLFRQKMKNLDLPKEKVSLAIELDAAPAAVLSRAIDEDHGNPLKLWQEMGSPLSLNKAEVRNLTVRSAVEDAPLPFDYSDGTLKLSAELGVNDVVFITVQL